MTKEKFSTSVLILPLVVILAHIFNSLIAAFVMHAMFALSGEVLPLVEKNTSGQLDYSARSITNSLSTVIVLWVGCKRGYKTLKKE